MAPVLSLGGAGLSILMALSMGGFLLWVVVHGFAHVFGWTWFPNDTKPLVQIVAHTVFFGTALGLVLDRPAYTETRPSRLRWRAYS